MAEQPSRISNYSALSRFAGAMGAANGKLFGININEHFPYRVPVQAVIKDSRPLDSLQLPFRLAVDDSIHHHQRHQ